MGDNTKSTHIRGKVFKIVDLGNIVLTIVITLLIGYLGQYIFSPLFIIAPIIGFLRVKVILNGYLIDLEKNILEFPGGGVLANDISDLINPNFIFQFFKRRKIKIKEIQQIQPDTEVRATNKGTVIKVHIMRITGVFGAVTLRFGSQGKRDQLYAMIREINNMGNPVVNL